MAKTGRPSKFDAKLAEKICEQIATTSKSLKTICKGKDMPSTVTVYAWLGNEKYKNFLNLYASAREAQGHLLAEEIIGIADDSTGDTTVNKQGENVVDGEFVQRSRLKIDARKWLASKLAPKKYGDKIQTEHSGSIEITPITGMNVK